MIIELKIPDLGESISEIQVGTWLKGPGERVEKDEPIVEIESEKATVELPAPETGVLQKQLLAEGDIAAPGALVGIIDTEAKASVAPKESASPSPVETPAAGKPIVETSPPVAAREEPALEPRVMPAAQRLLSDLGMAAAEVEPSGPGGRILKEDVQRAMQKRGARAVASRAEHVKRMGPLRKTIAVRLLEAQQSAALLTTFNEVDMSAVIALRREVGEQFKERHGVKLGFMSLFVKAVTQALRESPQVGVQIRGDEMVSFDYCDIGIAVGGGKGLVVPVLRNAETMSFAAIEQKIAELAGRAKAGKLSMEELSGGTFTISNGGIYGSMLSTPIVNPPQSGILGLHAIEDRPVARDGQVVIRPMMYVALTYDHRIIDGREAVTFLKGIKHRIENPARLMLELLED